MCIEINDFINRAEKIIKDQNVNKEIKKKIEAVINKNVKELRKYKTEKDITSNAVDLLNNLSQEAIDKSYRFIENSINSAMEKMFANTTRKIKIKEYTRGQYAQLEIEVDTGTGRPKKLKGGSGHGLGQIVSFLCIMTLIVITNSRRILILDEMFSGVSAKNRKILEDILWSFTEIGFQFIIIEHGFTPKGAKVYEIRNNANYGEVYDSYIADYGVYENNYNIDIKEIEQMGSEKYVTVKFDGNYVYSNAMEMMEDEGEFNTGVVADI